MVRDALSTVPEAAPQGSTPVVGVRRGSFRALRSLPFRLYFLGQVVSASGVFLQQTAVAGWSSRRRTLPSRWALCWLLEVSPLFSSVLGVALLPTDSIYESS